MTMIYDVIAKRHRGSSQPDVVLFYDEDKEKAISEMKKYVDKNGFVIIENEGRFTIGDVVLRERESTGKEISRKSYRELFDIFGKRLLS